MDDGSVIVKQLKRPLLTKATTAARCSQDFPTVTLNDSRTFDGAPFPTLYWLTCPTLHAAIARLESDGMTARLEQHIEADPRFRAELFESDKDYRRERDGNESLNVGIAGNRDPFKLKCLHAHAAHYLAGGMNPIGQKVMSLVGTPRDCEICRDL